MKAKIKRVRCSNMDQILPRFTGRPEAWTTPVDREGWVRMG